MKRTRRKQLAKISFTVLGIVCVILLSTSAVDAFRPYKRPTSEEVRKRLNYLQQSLSANEHSAIGYMGHEGVLFSLSYTALALSNINQSHPTLAKEYRDLAAIVAQKIQSENLKNRFRITSDSSIATTSVLYAAHLNFALSAAKELKVISEQDARLQHAINRQLSRAFAESKYGVLTSYHQSIWIPDNVAGLASMRMYEDAWELRHDSLIDTTFQLLVKNYVEPSYQLPYSTVNAVTGLAAEGPRGSMLGWSIIFASYVDSGVSASWYTAYKEHMSRNRLLFRLFKEWPTRDQNYDDMDSGPTLWGYSIPANAFALGGAILHNDDKTANKALRLMNWGRRSLETDSTLSYKTRAVQLDASPMMEALSLYLETLNAVD